jgi:hypothetical protein
MVKIGALDARAKSYVVSVVGVKATEMIGTTAAMGLGGIEAPVVVGARDARMSGRAGTVKAAMKAVGMSVGIPAVEGATVKVAGVRIATVVAMDVTVFKGATGKPARRRILTMVQGATGAIAPPGRTSTASAKADASVISTARARAAAGKGAREARQEISRAISMAERIRASSCLSASRSVATRMFLITACDSMRAVRKAISALMSV